MSLPSEHLYLFEDFAVDAEQKVLLRQGKPLPLAPKVFDTLLVLIENSGRIVPKEELMKRLWPDTFVEDANLTFNIQQLRKSLGDDARRPHYIETIARRGYRFIAGVEQVNNSEPIEYPNGNAVGTNGEHVVERVSSKRVSQPDQFASSPVDTRPSHVSRKLIALVGVMTILITGIAIVWKLPSVTFRPFVKNNLLVRNVAGLNKFEKLTANGQSQFVALSPDGKYLAYTNGLYDRVGIWLRQLATSTNLEIVPGPGIVYGLEFAKSGEYLYFVKGTIGGVNSLYRVPMLGGAPTKLFDGLEGNFSISWDDSQIAFVRQVINHAGQREYSLLIANADGSNQRTLLTRSHPDRLESPVWSPDNQSVICAYGSSASGTQDVSLVAIRVSDKTISAPSPKVRFAAIGRLAWLPNKSALILAARKDGTDNQLWRVSYPDLDVRVITEGAVSYADVSLSNSSDKAVAVQTVLTSNMWIGPSHGIRHLKAVTQATDHFCWTRDGQIVYSSKASGNADLWLMRRDGAGQRQLTVNAATNSTPAVTPDNRHIVFISNRTGSFQVWRMDLDGSNQFQLTDGAAKNYPHVSPDGKWVVYNTTDDWYLWKVSIDGGKQSQLTNYVSVFPAVSPDGKMIACIGRNESGRELLIVPFTGGSPSEKFEFFGWASRLQWTTDGKGVIYAGKRNRDQALIRQFLNGGLSEEPLNFDTDELFSFAYSFDNQFLAVTRGGWQHDVVLIDDLARYVL